MVRSPSTSALYVPSLLKFTAERLLILPLKLAVGNWSEFHPPGTIKMSWILGLVKAKFLIATSNATEPVFVSNAAMAVLFSAFGKASKLL